MGLEGTEEQDLVWSQQLLSYAKPVWQQEHRMNSRQDWPGLVRTGRGKADGISHRVEQDEAESRTQRLSALCTPAADRTIKCMTPPESLVSDKSGHLAGCPPVLESMYVKLHAHSSVYWVEN